MALSRKLFLAEIILEPLEIYINLKKNLTNPGIGRSFEPPYKR
jgi:hypothetical protein